ncbi:MAG: glycosyltransferase family 2 protein [Candidatus Acidiferrales bacterium]
MDVIIVNWNAGQQLRECLVALSGARRDGYMLGRVVVVDNASTDGSISGLNFPALPLSIIQNRSNRGFAAACNQAAAGSDADYLLFLNPDTKILSDTLAKSVQFMESPENSRTGIVGVQLLDENGAVRRHCSRFLATRYFIYMMLGLHRLFPARFPHLMYDEWDHLQSRRIEHVMGAYFFIRHSLFKEVGGFDERFFVYFEDVDLSLRAAQAGWYSYYLAEAQCYHACGGSSEQVKARRLFYILQSRILYGFKNFGIVSAVTLLLATLLIEPVSRLVQAIFRGSLAQIREVFLGYLLLWRALPRILGSDYLRKPEMLKLDFGKP